MAFNDYSSMGGTFDGVNTFMRNPKGHGVDKKIVRPTANRMAADFKNMDILPKGLLLFRGMSFNYERPNYRKGQKLNVSSFTSTSLDPGVAHGFATYKQHDDQVIWIIEIASQDIPGYLVGNPKETEVICKRSISPVCELCFTELG